MIHKHRLRLIAGLIAAILFDTALQLTWKTAASAGANATSLTPGFTNPLYLAVIALMTFQFFNWLVVLSEADLSYAKPVTSLSYATVPILSFFILHEAIAPLEVVGIVCVMAGVWFISQTKANTIPAAELDTR